MTQSTSAQVVTEALENIITVFNDDQQDRRNIMLEHLAQLETLDAIMMATVVRDVLEDPTGVVDKLAAAIKKARRDTLDLCLPDRESSDELD